MRSRGASFVAPLALVACASCATPPVPSASISQDDSAVLARSRAVFEAQGRGDREAMRALLADDFRYLSSIGKPDRTKAEEITLQGGVTVVEFSVEKPRVVPLAPGVVALHYLAHQRLATAGKPVICPHSGAMETWRREGPDWRMVTRTEWLISWDEKPGCGRP